MLWCAGGFERGDFSCNALILGELQSSQKGRCGSMTREVIMRVSFIVFVLFLAAPHLADAGHIYGTLRANNQPVANVSGQINCAGGDYGVRTDQRGSYSINIRQKGRCTLCISYGGQVATHDIYSYDNPVRYDFDLIRQGAGYILRRR
jgi:hypothetical protein